MTLHPNMGCFPTSCTTETSQPALEVYNIILILQSKKQAWSRSKVHHTRPLSNDRNKISTYLCGIKTQLLAKSDHLLLVKN